jgi:hypothetical protein
MAAIWMLVRAKWRRHVRASLFLAIVAGLAAGLVGASFQAAARADSSLERFTQRSRVYDEVVQGCPPGVDVDAIESTAEAIRLCTNPTTAERFREVVRTRPDVERTTLTSILVVAILDKASSNGWGHLTLLESAGTPGSPPAHGYPIVVEGRVVDGDAPDEIMVGEDAARVGGIHAGDTVRMSGWRQLNLDAAVDGSVKPETPPFDAKVVGIVRYLEDVQPNEEAELSDTVLPGNMYAGPGWFAAHHVGASSYGSGVLVRLRGGQRSVRAFEAAMSEGPEGWHVFFAPASDVSVSSVRDVIQLERNAVLIFAAIAILASVAFVGLTTLRQLRRESGDSVRLAAIGVTRRDLRMANVVRALTIAVPAAVVAATALVALSPLGPVGFARKLEFDVGVRFDAVIIVSTVLGVIALFAIVGFVVPVESRARRRSHVTRPSLVEPALREMGPVALIGGTIARGRSTHVATVVTAVALAAGLAAGGMVASYDRLIAEPSRYGAWWDVAVGQYSEQAPLDDGVAKLRANQAVIAAAGYQDEPDIATIDGHKTRLVASVNYVGERHPVVAAGRAPGAVDEIALGDTTAATLHKRIGDEVTVKSERYRRRLRVVGIVVISDPISSQRRAGDGAYVTRPLLANIAGPGTVAQSIVVALDPKIDRARAIESVRRDFYGSIRKPAPQVDLRNLGHMRTVPWLIAALIALLALATLIHALVLMLSRNRTTVAVLAALGFTRRQRRAVGLFASVALVFVGIVIAIPVGLIAGDRIWRSVTDRTGVVSHSTVAWTTLIAAPLAALAIAALVALATSRATVRMTPSEQLRVE